MRTIRTSILLLSIFFTACAEKNLAPKPKGYKQIERDSITWIAYQNTFLTLEHASDASLQVVQDAGDGKWFNIRYAAYNATIHCTYTPITYATLSNAIEDSYKLAYNHTSRADDIEEIVYEDSINNVAGILYRIEGEVATPLQFFVTDSITHFFRGSVYYDQVMNQDSIAPITSFLKSDVEHIMKSVRWERY